MTKGFRTVFENDGGAIVRRPARIWTGKNWQNINEIVSPEETVRVRYAGGECRLQAWPGNPDHPEWQRDLEDLCLGHILLDKQHTGSEDGPPRVRQNGHATAARDSEGNHIVDVHLEASPTSDRPETASTLTPEALLLHMETFLTRPGTCPGIWEATGCFHRAAMLDVRTGVFVHMAEDIGRHNCLDRLAGWACRHGLFPEDFALFLSARITGSLYAKARRAGFRFLISRAAVTTAPLDACLRMEQAGMEQAGEQAGSDARVTLVGFCRPREGRFTIFHDPAHRVRV